MAEENVDLVRRMYDAFRRGDPDATLAFFDEDVVVDAGHREAAGGSR